MLRQLHSPLTLRKEYCVSQLEKLKKGHEKSSEVSQCRWQYSCSSTINCNISYCSSWRSICYLKANTTLVCERWHEVSVSNKYSLFHTCVCSDSFNKIFPHSCFTGHVTPELLLTGFLQCWPGFNPSEIHVTFVVKEIELGEVSLQEFCFFFFLTETPSGASSPTVRIILRNTCSCVKHLVPRVSSF